MPLAILGCVLLGVTLAAQFMVTRLGVSLKKLAPDLKRLNPANRLRELPRQNIPALLQAVVMLPVFGSAVYFLVRDDFQAFLSLPLKSVSAGAAQVGGSIQTLLWKASFVFLVFGAVDLLRQKRRYQQDLRMSKQEIRDELKEVEPGKMQNPVAELGRSAYNFTRCTSGGKAKPAPSPPETNPDFTRCTSGGKAKLKLINTASATYFTRCTSGGKAKPLTRQVCR